MNFYINYDTYSLAALPSANEVPVKKFSELPLHVRMLGVLAGFSGLAIGWQIVAAAAKLATPEAPPLEISREWKKVATHGSWDVRCRDNNLKRRTECRLEAHWPTHGGGAVSYDIVERQILVANRPMPSGVAISVDGGDALTGECAAMCMLRDTADLLKKAESGARISVALEGKNQPVELPLAGFRQALEAGRVQMKLGMR